MTSFVFFFVTQPSSSGVHSSPLSLLLLQLLYCLFLLFLTLLFFWDLTSKNRIFMTFYLPCNIVFYLKFSWVQYSSLVFSSHTRIIVPLHVPF